MQVQSDHCNEHADQFIEALIEARASLIKPVGRALSVDG